MLGMFTKIAVWTSRNDVPNIGDAAQRLRKEMVAVVLRRLFVTVPATVTKGFKSLLPLLSIPAHRGSVKFLHRGEIVGSQTVLTQGSTTTMKRVGEFDATLSAHCGNGSSIRDSAPALPSVVGIVFALSLLQAVRAKFVKIFAVLVPKGTSAGFANLLNDGTYFARAATETTLGMTTNCRNVIERLAAVFAGCLISLSNVGVLAVLRSAAVITGVPGWAALAGIDVIEHLSALQAWLSNSISSLVLHGCFSPMRPSAVMPIGLTVNCWKLLRAETRQRMVQATARPAEKFSDWTISSQACY
jgi:hypothetical protein